VTLLFVDQDVIKAQLLDDDDDDDYYYYHHPQKKRAAPATHERQAAPVVQWQKSEYELQRAARIEANNAFLAELGLSNNNNNNNKNKGRR